MESLVESLSLLFPPWLQSIGTAAVGALLAYATWSWLHSPYLYPGTVVHKDVIEPDQDEAQQSIRLPVQNIGTRAAENCEAVLNLRVRINDDVVRSFHSVPWLPTQAELVVDDAEFAERTTIPADRSGTLELVRQDRDGGTQIYPHIGGEKFIRTSPEDPYHCPVGEPVDYAVLSQNRSTSSDVIRTHGKLRKEDIVAGEWEEAILELIIETESARPLKIHFDAEVGSEGELSFERRALSSKRQMVSNLYKAINRLRKFGG